MGPQRIEHNLTTTMILLETHNLNIVTQYLIFYFSDFVPLNMKLKKISKSSLEVYISKKKTTLLKQLHFEK